MNTNNRIPHDYTIFIKEIAQEIDARKVSNVYKHEQKGVKGVFISMIDDDDDSNGLFVPAPLPEDPDAVSSAFRKAIDRRFVSNMQRVEKISDRLKAAEEKLKLLHRNNDDAAASQVMTVMFLRKAVADTERSEMERTELWIQDAFFRRLIRRIAKAKR